MTFGTELVELREDREIGRKKLADVTGLSLSYLHYIENDRVLPGRDNLKKIARGINKLSPGNKVSAEELIRKRDRLELERFGLDGNKAELTLLLKERGPLSDEDRQKLERTIARVLNDPRSQATKKQRG